MLATVTGLSAGYLSGSTETRAKSALEFLISLATEKTRFDISAGDIDLTGMMVRKITRQKTAENENGLIATVQLQQVGTLATVIALNQPSISQLNSDDPSYASNAATANKGEVIGGTVSDSYESYVSGVLG